MNCTTMENPCLTIQYAIDFLATSNDVIKIDGSQGTFVAPHELLISNCMNITFTSYNGVVWTHLDREGHGMGRFLRVDYPKT